MVAVMPCAVLQAEVIQTINFNPARLGQYERLKVSEKATFQGGLTAQSMQVRSGGTVSINESNSGARPNLPWTFPVRVSLLWKIA